MCHRKSPEEALPGRGRWQNGSVRHSGKAKIFGGNSELSARAVCLIFLTVFFFRLGEISRKRSKCIAWN